MRSGSASRCAASISAGARAGGWRARQLAGALDTGRAGRGTRPAAPAHAPPRRRARGRGGKGGEIDMRGQVGVARIGQRVGRLPAAQRLQAVARRAVFRAVVEEQRRAAVRAPAARRDAAASARAGSQSSDALALALHAGPRRKRERRRLRRHLDEPPAVHEPLRPARAAPHELADRQRVEELVGQQQQRPVGQRPRCASCHARVRQPRGLRARAAAARSRSDAAAARAAKAGRGRRGSRAARRPSACRAPARPRPAAPGRARPSPARSPPPRAPSSSPNTWVISGAVVKSANGSRRRVVGGVGARHECVQPLRHAGAGTLRPRARQDQPDAGEQHRHRQQLAHGQRRSNRKPRNGSGWRKNSPMMRATA